MPTANRMFGMVVVAEMVYPLSGMWFLASNNEGVCAPAAQGRGGGCVECGKRVESLVVSSVIAIGMRMSGCDSRAVVNWSDELSECLASTQLMRRMRRSLVE